MTSQRLELRQYTKADAVAMAEELLGLLDEIGEDIAASHMSMVLDMIRHDPHQVNH